MKNNKNKELQQKLNDNIDNAVKLAEKNTIRNEQGYVVYTKDEIDDIEEFLGLDHIKPVNVDLNDDSDFEDWYNDELYNLTLKQIIEKNRTDTTLLGSKIEEQQYSDELIKQCKEEFETFVKPIRDKVLGRYDSLENNSKETIDNKLNK
jgi:hypothetical protein